MVETFDALIRGAGPWGMLALFVAAAVEYLFPPFPGDTVTLLGGVYAVRGQLSVVAVYLAILAGSLAGASADYAIGRAVGRRLASGEGRWGRLIRPETLLKLEEQFARRGDLLLVVNRFVPGARGPIFLVAGAMGLPFARVMLLGGLSALVWNGLLFAAGYAVGGEAERLQGLVNRYGEVALGVMVALAVFFSVRAWRRRRSEARPS